MKDIKEELKNIYPDSKWYGPYKRKDGRAYLVKYVRSEEGSKTSSKLLSRAKIEVKLQRKLSRDEEVDHIDGDSTNDSYENLQLLTSYGNKRKHHEENPSNQQQLTSCYVCDKDFYVKKYKLEEDKDLMCSRSCLNVYNSLYRENHNQYS